MDVETLSYGEILIMPLIIGIIQAAKRFWPDAAGNVWFGLSLLLGLVFQVAIFLVAHPDPGRWDYATWLLLVVLTIAFALAAGKAYDRGHDPEASGSFSVQRLLKG